MTISQRCAGRRIDLTVDSQVLAWLSMIESFGYQNEREITLQIQSKYEPFDLIWEYSEKYLLKTSDK